MTRPPLGIMPRYIFEEFRCECVAPIEFYSYDLDRWIALIATIRRCGYTSSSFSWHAEKNAIQEWRLYHSINTN